jgi:hypothetical protein
MMMMTNNDCTVSTYYNTTIQYDPSNTRSLSQDISKALDRTKALVEEQGKWEEATKLKVRQAKTVVRQANDKLSSTLRSTNGVVDKVRE